MEADSTHNSGPGPIPSWKVLVETVEQLSGARTIDDVVAVVRRSARRVSQADGVTFVLRDGDLCHYVDEDAIGPLWKGQKFPLSACISGWAMLNKQTAVVPDIYADPRIPHDAYRPTFVRSLVMVPVRTEAPLAAIGSYWAEQHEPLLGEVELLETLARATATALVNVSLDAQRTQAEAQLQQAQKMEAIGQLTGGMAHDFNNLLGIIIGNLDMLQPQLPEDEEAAELLRDALDAALRGADLTRRLLAFARRQPLRPQQVEPNALVSGMVKLLSRTLGEAIEISLNLSPDVPTIVVDPAQLEASIVNLANNARDAMPRGGGLMIKTDRRCLDTDYALLYPEVNPGDYVMIEISDTGTGMPPDVLKRVFEPFFTTKGPAKGTGLGLSMVFGFMKQSSGHINVYSEEGAGTTFRLYLPCGGPESKNADRPSATAGAIGGHEVVLVVEDNEAMRRVVARQLGRLGYTVVEADNGPAALAVLGQKKIDILLTDVVMPGGMDGIELARAATAAHPALKVVLTSGFPEGNFAARTGGIAGMRLLSKPYRREDLASTLRETLSDG